MAVVARARSRLLGGLAAVLAVAGLAGCTSAPGEDPPPAIVPGRPGEPATTLSPGQAPPRPVTPPNAADVRYMQNMIVHHQQAIEMARLAPQRAASDDVKRIAERIAASQQPEIDMMNAWLREHGQQTVEPSHAGHESHDPATMPGMATSAQLDALRGASGTAFDTMFLQLMITHHQGALTMAGEVQIKGYDVRVQEIADDVIATQTAEINRMRVLAPH
jgi:uncharacterized protein (DUF305 family)